MVDPARIPLCLLPTPCHRLDRASDALGIDLWIKRDDLTGFAMGGNKGRKLEFLLGEAVRECADVVVTCGSVQSNFVRQLAAGCAVTQLKFAAALMHHPYEPLPGVRPPDSLGVAREPPTGNMVLNEWFDADLRIYPDGTWEELFRLASEIASEYRAQGAKVFEIPVGGSSPVGAYAFWLAGREVSGFDSIVTASSSGSTQVGLAMALAGSLTRVVGVLCDPEPDLPEDFAKLSQGLAALLGEGGSLTAGDFEVRLDYVGPGYGYPSEDGQAAIRFLAREEGIFLDPIYSGKAFAGLIDMARRGQLDGRVLFWHTGGTPALFA